MVPRAIHPEQSQLTISQAPVEVEESGDWVFRECLGLTYTPSSMPLEYIKLFFKITMCDAMEINRLLNILKIQCFKSCKINEYSDECLYREVILRFVLGDVTCDFCCNVKNVDLFNEFEEQVRGWRCICNALFPATQIENKVLNMLQALRNQLVSNVLHCNVCKFIREDFMSEKCSCGGRYGKLKEEHVRAYETEAQAGFPNFKRLSSLAGMSRLSHYLSFF